MEGNNNKVVDSGEAEEYYDPEEAEAIVEEKWVQKKANYKIDKFRGNTKKGEYSREINKQNLDMAVDKLFYEEAYLNRFKDVDPEEEKFEIEKFEILGLLKILEDTKKDNKKEQYNKEAKRLRPVYGKVKPVDLANNRKAKKGNYKAQPVCKPDKEVVDLDLIYELEYGLGLTHDKAVSLEKHCREKENKENPKKVVTKEKKYKYSYKDEIEDLKTELVKIKNDIIDLYKFKTGLLKYRI